MIKLSNPIDAIANTANEVIKRVWPDPAQQAVELRKLEELRQRGDLAELEAYTNTMLAQIEVNKIDAQSSSKWQSGWRPAVGWIGVVALGLAVIPKVMAITIAWSWQVALILDAWVPIGLDGTPNPFPVLPDFPDLGTGDVLALLGGILGVGTMRSVDRHNRIKAGRLG